jgi:hypothetical protein
VSKPCGLISGRDSRLNDLALFFQRRPLQFSVRVVRRYFGAGPAPIDLTEKRGPTVRESAIAGAR